MSGSKNNPRNISHMPVVVFIALLDLEKKSSFVYRHYLAQTQAPAEIRRTFSL
jgi:hypothetical protein